MPIDANRMIKSNSYVSIWRKPKIDNFSCDGIIIKESKLLILVKKENDFIFDGYIILRKKDITKIDTSEKIFFHGSILRKEYKLSPIKLPRINNIESWYSVFDNISHNTFSIFEVEGPEYTQFLLGTIDSFTKDFLFVWHNDACGSKSKKPIKLNIANLTKVQFGNKYIKMFTKYKR